jgi:hypothetical protein
MGTAIVPERKSERFGSRVAKRVVSSGFPLKRTLRRRFVNKYDSQGRRKGHHLTLRPVKMRRVERRCEDTQTKKKGGLLGREMTGESEVMVPTTCTCEEEEIDADTS